MESLWIKFHLRKKKEEKGLMDELERKKYECPFFIKEFRNSQALQGHYNSHKLKTIILIS